MITIQTTPIDAYELTREIEQRSTGHGATVTFTGTMRELSSNHEPLKALYLEHYPGMTEKSLTELLAEAKNRFDLIVLPAMIPKCQPVRLKIFCGNRFVVPNL